MGSSVHLKLSFLTVKVAKHNSAQEQDTMYGLATAEETSTAGSISTLTQTIPPTREHTLITASMRWQNMIRLP